MNAIAKYKYAHISAQKARLVADVIRGAGVEKAVNYLKFSDKKAAHLVKKTLDSAIANAEHNFSADIDELKVSTIYVDEAPSQKRFRARARGRSNRITKRSCHITIIVSDTGV